MVRLYWSDVILSNCRREFGPASSLGLQFPFPKTASWPMENTHSRFPSSSPGSSSSSTSSERSTYQDTEKRESRDDWEGMLHPNLIEPDSCTVRFDSNSSTCSRTSAEVQQDEKKTKMGSKNEDVIKWRVINGSPANLCSVIPEDK